MEAVPPAVEWLVRAMARQPEVSRVWLYGSRARGDHRERSDVDLAVEAPGATIRQWLELCALAEDTETLLPIDVVRLEEASEALRARIRSEGKVLYER